MKFAHRIVAALLLSTASQLSLAADQVISGDEIARALGEHPKTRGLTTRGLATRGLATGEPATRGITLRARTEAREMIDLNIPFELNSSDLKPEAVAQLTQLEAALKTDSLADSRFRITGHTDASGSVDHNRTLSLRRAKSVQRFLADHGVDATRLDIAGAGSDQLLLPDAPRDGANRRVEIRNLGKVQP